MMIAQESGWMDQKTFEKYLQKFYEIIEKKRKTFIEDGKEVKENVLILLDGHTSRFSLKTCQEARKNDIILMISPANTTHIVQPLDVYLAL